MYMFNTTYNSIGGIINHTLKLDIRSSQESGKCVKYVLTKEELEKYNK